MDIIFLALPRPDSQYSSTSFSLAKEFSRTNRVFYLENPFTIKDFIALRRSPEVKARKNALLWGKEYVRKIGGLPEGFFHVVPRLIFPVNWLSEGLLYNLISKWNDRIIYKTIRKLIRDYDLKNFIYVNSFNPFIGQYFPKQFRPSLFFYHTVDDISQAIFVSKHGLRLENRLVQQADVTVTTSKELQRLKSALSDNVYQIPNAADLAIFSKALHNKFPRPVEYEGKDKKIVIYIGNIKDRIDFPLCKRVAERSPDLFFVFIGPINTDEHIRLGLDRMKNVAFLGPRSMGELPPYLQHASCAMIPFEYSILTKSIYPLKINEYLGAGIPVVATRFSEDIDSFKEVAYVVDNEQEFVEALAYAIHNDSGELRIKRYNAAAENTWEKRAAEFLELIRVYSDRKNGRR